MNQLPKAKKIAIMIAVMTAMTFASLNQTIIGTAMPKIISSIGGMEYYSWVFTIYLLSASMAAILVGKLSDIYGRKPFLLAGIFIFSIATFLNGLSSTIIHLILFRAIQGVGGGMIMSLSFSAAGDIFPPRERGRWQGLTMSTFGVSSIIAPTLGGWIVDNTAWHWVFWVFLPFGIVAFLMIWYLFPSRPQKEREPIDFLGSLFLSLCIVPMLLAFSRAGTNNSWLAPEILGLFGISLAALIMFIIVERRVKSPVLPLSLFGNSIFTISSLASFSLGVGMFSVLMFMPMYVQGVIGISATFSGLIVMPMTLCMVAASSISGQIVSKTGKYKKLGMFGLLIMAAGIWALSFMDTDTSSSWATINMMIVGIGLGMSLPIYALTVQNAVDHNLLGVATASSQLFRQMGGTIGVSVMGSLLNGRMNTRLAALMTEKTEVPVAIAPAISDKLALLENPQVLMNHEQLSEIIRSLPAQVQPYAADYISKLREALGWSLSGIFLTGAGLLAGAFLLAMLLEEIPLRTTFAKDTKSGAVIHEAK